MTQGHWFASNRFRLQVILYYSLSWTSSEWNVGVRKFGPRGKMLGSYVTALHQSGRTWKYIATGCSQDRPLFVEGNIDQVKKFSIIHITLTCTDAVGNLVATYVNIDWRQ